MNWFRRIASRDREWASITEIQRFEDISPKSFAICIAKPGLPVLVSAGTLLKKPHVVRILRRNIGSQVVKIRVGDYANPLVYKNKRRYQQLSIDGYMRPLISSRGRNQGYIGNHPISKSLCLELGMPRELYQPVSDFDSATLWFGPKGTVTPLHKDSSDNLALHVYGAKRWLLFRPRDASELSLQPVAAEFEASTLDLRKPEILATLAKKGIIPIVVTVRAGEMLYVPAGWAHFVESLRETVMVALWKQYSVIPGFLTAK